MTVNSEKTVFFFLNIKTKFFSLILDIEFGAMIETVALGACCSVFLIRVRALTKST